MLNENLLSGIAIFRRKNGTLEWLLVKPAQSQNWEFPKTQVRRAESSVSSIIRAMREEGGFSVRVLEEAGRAVASITKDGKKQGGRIIFYLAEFISRETRVNSYQEIKWLPYGQAVRRATFTRERKILRQANKILKEWSKKKRS